jgi:predicted peptidase
MRSVRTLVLAIAALLSGSWGASAQTGETGFLNRSVAVDGAAYRYQVYVPREYVRSTASPIILALHGGGSYGRDVSRRMAASLKAIGANVQYTELPGVGHNAWDPAYERADLATWLFKQQRR